MSATPAGPSVKTEGWEPLGEVPGAGSRVEQAMVSRIEELLRKADRAESLGARLRSALLHCQGALRSDPPGTSTAGACDLSRVEVAATGDETRSVVRNAVPFGIRPPVACRPGRLAQLILSARPIAEACKWRNACPKRVK